MKFLLICGNIILQFYIIHKKRNGHLTVSFSAFGQARFNKKTPFGVLSPHLSQFLTKQMSVCVFLLETLGQARSNKKTPFGILSPHLSQFLTKQLSVCVFLLETLGQARSNKKNTFRHFKSAPLAVSYETDVGLRVSIKKHLGKPAPIKKHLSVLICWSG